MSKYLKQSEIDRLVEEARDRATATDEGDEQAESVRPFDFVSPSRAAREVVTLLRAVHETFQYGLVSVLSGQLRAPVEVDLLGVEPLSYQEYSLSLATPSILGVFELGSAQTEAVIEIQPPLAGSMIERMFGGDGESPATVRELTPIEHAVMVRTVTHVVRELESAWREHAELGLELRSVERNPQFLQSMVPSETLLLTTFEVRVGACTGLITLTYPQSALDSISSDVLNRHRVQRVRQWAGESSRPLAQHLREAPVELVGRLGTAEISVGDIARLAVGDVLRLDRRVDEDIDVLIGDLAKLRARPGVRRSSRALMITRVEKEVNDE